MNFDHPNRTTPKTAEQERTPDQSDRIDFSKIRKSTKLPGLTIHAYQEIGSTNDVALKNLKLGKVESPALFVTQVQTAGRGQRSKQWWSSNNSLTFSMVLKFQAPPTPASETVQPTATLNFSNWTLAPLLVAWAMTQAIELAIDLPTTIKIKWPNDLLISEAKIAGILVESVLKKDSVALVVGVGVNVNQTNQEFPDEPEHNRTSIRSATNSKQPLDRTDLLISICQNIESLTKPAGPTPQEILKKIESRLAFHSERVTITLPSGKIANGILTGIDHLGGIVLKIADQQPQTFYSGTLRKISN